MQKIMNDDLMFHIDRVLNRLTTNDSKIDLLERPNALYYITVKLPTNIMKTENI